jgi:hypothetical protein
LWLSTEHNSIPNTDKRSDNSSPTGDLKETGKTKRLKHFSGDFVLEGRFGTSIRFGASHEKVAATPWKGTESSPLFILRNNPSSNSSESNLEDLNTDGTTIGIFTDQVIDFIPANLNFDTYNTIINNSPATVIKAQKEELVTENVEIPKQVDQKRQIEKEVVSSKKSPVESSVKTVGDIEDSEFLPDTEPVQYAQILEISSARHVDGDNSDWTSRVDQMQAPLTTPTEFAKDIYDAYFLTYMQYQQGYAGIQAIISSAKKGLLTVPINNGYAREDINRNMRKNVGSSLPGASLTPAAFLNFWYGKYKYAVNASKTFKIKEPVNSIILKYSARHILPPWLVKIVCFHESSFLPRAGENIKDRVNLGLFSVTLKSMKKIYPSAVREDLFDPEKNANVGLSQLREALQNSIKIIKLFNK